MKTSSPPCRDIRGLVLGSAGQNQPLNIHPAQIFWSQASLLLSLGFIEFHKQDTDEKVEQEHATHQNKNYEEYRW